MATGSMDRRAFLAALAAGGAMLASGCRATAPAAAIRGQRPNIIYITADDLGYGDLSGYGRADFRTPALDRLATQGTRFTQAYAIAPICTPTRVGFMTGRHPARHPVGLYEPITDTAEHRTIGLAPSPPTLPLLLRQAGYTNALFGKWHLGVAPEFRPSRHGFDEFFGPLSGAVDYVSHTEPSGAHDLYRNDHPVEVQGYLTDLLADEAVRFIAARREPFFLSHQGTAPHSPWQRRGDPPVGPGKGPYDSGPPDRFPDMVRALDQAVARIVAAVDAAGLGERTLIVFTSDNGGVRHSSMGGLAGGKAQLWEGGIRVPAFARWPGTIPAGLTTTQVASTLDWSATILAAAGATADPAQPLDGMDLLPLLTGRAPEHHRTLFWRTTQRTRQAAVRDGSWKYLRDEDGEYLFDLALDPGERRDLKATQADRFATLRAAYATWNAGMLVPPWDADRAG
jgi:arylsulfatase A-like enzyme